jgi:hypothetical protein
MRRQKVILSILICLILASCPIAAYALTVRANDIEIGSGAGTVSLNVTTADGFTITGSVVAQQSGSLERIIFQGVTITAPTSCSVEFPCILTITATGDASDFPTPKPTGGYPSGVVMSGFFDGTVDANDAISLTGFAGAAQDAINATPGADPATDTGTSLPSTCAGDQSCRFSADGGSFYDQIAETVQHECGELSECPPSLTVSVTVNFVNPGVSVNLPAGVVAANSPGDLSGALPQPFSAFSGRLAGNDRPGTGKDTFDLNSSFTIGAGSNGIRCLNEEVLLSIGKSISISLAAGSMHESAQGACVFSGRRNGWDLQVVINQNGPVNFNASYRGSGGNLNGIVDGKTETVKLSIGDDYGSFLVIPDIR